MGRRELLKKRTTVLNKSCQSKWSSKTGNRINKQQQTINPKPQRKMKWKTACCRPQASEQRSGGEDKIRQHTESFRTQSWLWSLQANYSLLQPSVLLSRWKCGYVWLCKCKNKASFCPECSFTGSIWGEGICTWPGDVPVWVCICKQECLMCICNFNTSNTFQSSSI